jgi:LEA14-like dessication related protein
MRALFAETVLAAFLTLSGCAKPEPPRVTPKAIQVTALGPAAVDLAIELDVYNPNSFPLTAQSVEGSLLLGSGVELARGRAVPEHSIPAKDSATVTTALNVPWTNLGALVPLATSDQPVPYKFVGAARIGGERLNVSVPFELNGQLTRPQLIQIGLKGLFPLAVPTP